jgi:phenylacetate-CoA ligase
VEFYGCTEAAPHSGGYSCPASKRPGKPVTTHLMEDFQVWELIDPDTKTTVPEGQRGITVCTNLNSESSTQLRFVVGDYTTFTSARCDCGRTHVRAIGGFQGRADDLVNLRAIKFYPSVLEEAVRSVPGIGDEYEIVLATNPQGIDTLTARVEHADHAAPAAVAERVGREITNRIELKVDVEVVAPHTFPKTEFKAKRIVDRRKKG